MDLRAAFDLDLELAGQVVFGRHDLGPFLFRRVVVGLLKRSDANDGFAQRGAFVAAADRSLWRWLLSRDPAAIGRGKSKALMRSTYGSCEIESRFFC